MAINFSVIGGDLRIIKLAKILAQEENMIYTYGLEKAEELKDIKNIKFCEKLDEAINENTKIVIGPIPFSSDKKNINTPFSERKISIENLINNSNNKILIAGGISKQLNNIEKNIKIVDILEQEELAILNAISTAEGAIEIAMANTEKIIHKSEILILGFGRIGKVLANKLSALSAKITCAARKKEDLAWIKAYGYEAENIELLENNLHKYEIIINTIPSLVLTKKHIEKVNKECLLIDLASNPRRN